jgi:DNA-binding response OmpR family regulator
MTSTREIRQYELENKLPRCRIVALTGLASASARLEALSSGVDQFMTKPMNFRALEALLKRGYERRRKASESAIPKLQKEEEKGTEYVESGLSSHQEIGLQQGGETTEQYQGAVEKDKEDKEMGWSSGDKVDPPQCETTRHDQSTEEKVTEIKEVAQSPQDKTSSQQEGEGTKQPQGVEEKPKEDKAAEQSFRDKASSQQEAVSAERVEEAKETKSPQEVQKAGT